MKILTQFASATLVVIVAIALGLFTAHQFAMVYEFTTGLTLGGSFLDFTDVIGWIFSSLFFIALFLGALSNQVARGAMILISVLALLFFFQAEPSTIYFPIALGLIGYGLGWGGRKLLKK